MKLLIFILFSSLVYASEQPIVPILYTLTHPQMPHKIIVLGSMHTKFKLSDFPEYIQKLLVSAHQIFLELNETEEFKKFMPIDQPIQKDYFLKLINKHSLSDMLRDYSVTKPSAVDHEIGLLAYISGTPLHGLDDIIAHPHPKTDWMSILLQKIVLLVFRDQINKLQNAYQNGEVEVIFDELMTENDLRLQDNISRESGWIGRILPKLTDTTLLNLVVVGVAHLKLGKNRFLTLFEEAGWNVEKFDHNNRRDVKTLNETLRVALLDITSRSTLTE